MIIDQQMSQNQQQTKTMCFNDDGNNNHQELCWNCMKTGELSCCDNCFRSFHKVCIRKLPAKILDTFMQKNIKLKTYLENKQIKKFPVNNAIMQAKENNSVISCPQHLFPMGSNKPWLCQICLQRYFCLCLNCQEKIEDPQHNLMCSVCYRFVHADCCNIPQDLFRKSITIVSFEIKGIRNFVCGECFSKFKIGKVLRFEKIATNQNSGSIGNQHKLTMIKHQYLFANTGLASPIHLGWVRSDLDNLKTIKPQIFKERAIVQIITMKCPLKYSSASIQTILNKFFQTEKNSKNQLRNKEQNNSKRFYGHYDNFKFLCRWDGADYHNLSWEDEVVVVKYEVALRKYLYSKIIKHRPLQSKQQSLLSIIPVKNSTIPHDDLPLLRKLQQRFQQYQTQIFTVRKQQHITKYSLLCHLINYIKKVHLCLLDIKSVSLRMGSLDQQRTYIDWQKFQNISVKIKPIVIICAQKNVNNWQKYFKICCPVLDVLYFCGTEANIKTIRLKKYFDFQSDKKIKFQVFLISFEVYQKELQREFFMSIPEIAQSEIVIVDEDQPLGFFSISSGFKSKMLYLVRRDASSKVQLDIKDKIIQLHGLKGTIQYTTSTEQIMTDLSLTSQQKRKLQQKLISVINQDVLKYTNATTLSQLKRIAFLRYIMCFGIKFQQKEQMCDHICKFAPTIFTGQQQQKTILKEYLTKLLALLYQYNNPYIEQRYIKFYLFDFQRAEVYKRICQLYKLKKKFQAYAKTPEFFPIERPFELFVNNQLLKFHMWNNLEDYILVGLLLQKGYGRWQTILQSKNWAQSIQDTQIYSKYMIGKEKQEKYKDHVQHIVISETKQISAGNLYRILEDRFAIYLKLMK